MSFWTAVVLIVMISAIAGVMRSRKGGNSQIRHQGDDAHSEANALPSHREKELESEVVSLRERVKVLERIATDPARRTAEEIEKLRDE